MAEEQTLKKEQEQQQIKDNVQKANQENEITPEMIKEKGIQITDPIIIKEIAGDKDDVQAVYFIESDDGKPQIVAENSEGKYEEIESRSIDRTPETINKFNVNDEREKGAGTKLTMKGAHRDVELSINQDGYGDFQVNVMDNTDGMGKKEAYNIGSKTEPTKEEQVAMYEKYGTGIFVNDNEILLTKEEIDTRLADELDSIRDEVSSQIKDMPKNPTIQQLEEKIDLARQQYEKQMEEKEDEQENDEKERDEEEYEKVPWDTHPHP